MIFSWVFLLVTHMVYISTKKNIFQEALQESGFFLHAKNVYEMDETCELASKFLFSCFLKKKLN